MKPIPWWQESVCYQIYLPSFCDGNGDGRGDFPGMLTRLDHLAALGVGAVWITPFYPSPLVDNGYDISDYCAVDRALAIWATSAAWWRAAMRAASG